MDPLIKLIDDRQALYDYFNDSILTTYNRLRAHRGLERDLNLLKSYIVEPAPVIRTLRNKPTTYDIHKKGSKYKANIKRSSDDSLLLVTWNIGEPFTNIIIDTSFNDRFWIIHTLSKSNHTDRITSFLSENLLLYDNIWLQQSMLEELMGLGEFRGFGIDYENLISSNIFDTDANDDRPTFKGQFTSSGNSGKLYSYLKNSAEMLSMLSLSKVKIKIMNSPHNDYGKEYILADIKASGKITVRGNSFATHLLLIEKILIMYNKIITNIEENVIFVDKATGQYNGKPITIMFGSNSVLNIDEAFSIIFTGESPFKLSGYIANRNSNKIAVRCIDNHTGSDLTIEIYRDRIIVYIYSNSCGNSILRLIFNINRYFARGAYLA